MSGADPRPAAKSLADTLRFAEAVAAKQGWVLNPDEGLRDQVCRGLSTNHGRYGFFLCPCRDGEGDLAQDKDIRCPCDYAKPDIAEFGHCFCGLYLSKAFHQSGRSPESIPERRPQ